MELKHAPMFVPVCASALCFVLIDLAVMFAYLQIQPLVLSDTQILPQAPPPAQHVLPDGQVITVEPEGARQAVEAVLQPTLLDPDYQGAGVFEAAVISALAHQEPALRKVGWGSEYAERKHAARIRKIAGASVRIGRRHLTGHVKDVHHYIAMGDMSVANWWKKLRLYTIATTHLVV